jgi:hypothetical protein
MDRDYPSSGPKHEPKNGMDLYDPNLSTEKQFLFSIGCWHQEYRPIGTYTNRITETRTGIQVQKRSFFNNRVQLPTIEGKLGTSFSFKT